MLKENSKTIVSQQPTQAKYHEKKSKLNTEEFRNYFEVSFHTTFVVVDFVMFCESKWINMSAIMKRVESMQCDLIRQRQSSYSETTTTIYYQ
jgi:hypothetical protein